MSRLNDGSSIRHSSANSRNRGRSTNIPDIRTRLSLGHGRNLTSHLTGNQLQVTTDLSPDMMNEVPTLVTPTNSRSEVNGDDVSAGMSRRTPNTFESGSAGTPRSVGGIKSSGMKGGARRISASKGGMVRDMHHLTPTQRSTTSKALLCTPSPRPSESFSFDRETKISSASVRRAQRSASDKSSNTSSALTKRNKGKEALLVGPRRILCARTPRSEHETCPKKAIIPSNSSVFKSTFSSRSKEVKSHQKKSVTSTKCDKEVKKLQSNVDQCVVKEVRNMAKDFDCESSSCGDQKRIDAIREKVNNMREESQYQQNLLDECILNQSASSEDLINSSSESSQRDQSRSSTPNNLTPQNSPVESETNESYDSVSEHFLYSGNALARFVPVATESENQAGGRANPMAETLSGEDVEIAPN